jgi:hypothetical protein
MMKRFDMGMSLAVCFAAMIWGAVAHADSLAVTVQGVGVHSCGQFIGAIGKSPPYEYIDTRSGHFVSENAEYQEWLLGYVSAFNATWSAFSAAHPGEEWQIDLFKRIDLAGMDLWMRNWCNQHPTQKVVDGALEFIHEMLTNAAAARR